MAQPGLSHDADNFNRDLPKFSCTGCPGGDRGSLTHEQSGVLDPIGVKQLSQQKGDLSQSIAVLSQVAACKTNRLRCGTTVTRLLKR